MLYNIMLVSDLQHESAIIIHMSPSNNFLKNGIFRVFCTWDLSSHVELVVKNLPANAGDAGDMGLVLGLRRSPGGGYSNPLQYSWLESPVDRGAWQATVHRVTKGWTWLKWLQINTCTYIIRSYFLQTWTHLFLF